MKKLLIILFCFICSLAYPQAKVEIIKNRSGQTVYRKESTSNGYILRDRSGAVVSKAIYRGDKVYSYDRSGKLTHIMKK